MVLLTHRSLRQHTNPFRFAFPLFFFEPFFPQTLIVVVLIDALCLPCGRNVSHCTQESQETLGRACEYQRWLSISQVRTLWMRHLRFLPLRTVLP